MRAAARHARRTLGYVLLAGAGCVATPAARLDCVAPSRPMVRDVLYLGRAIPGGGEVDDARWARFQQDTIVPRLASGATFIDAHGFWRDRSAGLVTETTRILVVLHDGSAAMLEAVGAIATRYRETFSQHSVLREQSEVCATF